MTARNAPDPDFARRVRASFGRQGLMRTMGASIDKLERGEVHIGFPFGEALTQQHGFIHAGVVTAAADNACGYAAYTMMPPDTEVLTVEYKVNFLAPARGERFRAVGRVIRSGRTVTVCSGEVIAVEGGSEKTVAVMQATMMTVAK